MDTRSCRLVTLGVSHKNASVEQRAPLQFTPDELAPANRVLSCLPNVVESTIVSTCNRVEIYLVTDTPNDPFEVVAAVYERFGGRDVGPYRGLFRTRFERDAADHLFRVAAGVDSAVLGESEVLGQVKDAYSAACTAGSAGKVIHRLFHQAFRVGKQVRTDTGIGRGACSVSSAAVEMIGVRLDGYARANALIVGVNRMTRIAAARLGGEYGCRLAFANRTVAKAAALAAGFRSDGYGLDILPDLLAVADIVVCCTSSTRPIVTIEMMNDVMWRRGPRKSVLVDLAVPRDIDVPKDWNPLVEVIDLDDIGRFIAKRQQKRELEIPHAEAIIRSRLSEFHRWYETTAMATNENVEPVEIPPYRAPQFNSRRKRTVVGVARAES